MHEIQPDTAELDTLIGQSAEALRLGKEEIAFALWERILNLDPDNTRTLTMIGQRFFRQGDLHSAKKAFQRVVETNGSDQQQWINLALTLQGLKDEEGEAQAIRGALVVDPHDLVALILRANLLERQGKQHEAASAYGAVTSVAPPLEKLTPNLRPAVVKAMAYKAGYQASYGAYMDDYLASHYQTFKGEDLSRFKHSLDLLIGRKKRFDSKSMLYHFPGLLPLDFFERTRFPWLDQIEAGTDRIRDEFLGVLKAEAGFTPYLTYADDMPLSQFAELNNSPRWSAFHLYKSGAPVVGNVEKCPITMSLLGGSPQPDQPGRTPTAMFSLLKPHTKIPPHVGVSNARLVTHLPLIIPQDCGFRVGNTTRIWEPGKAWVFDDTIEHEAWNNSDKLRVVLIFDIWHPDLSIAEKGLITALSQGMTAFSGETLSFEL